jgi:uncharacterized membrane protein
MSATAAALGALASKAAAVPAADERAYRLSAIDALRGLVIVIMALDHCRDFLMLGTSQDPMSNPDITPLLFATRWITHFCAPTFVFLAGTSAGLMLARKSPAELGRFLLTRGLWLVFIEVSVISTGWTFAPEGIAQVGGHTMVILQVIWALGASMVVLAAAQLLGRRNCLILGAAIVLGHDLLDGIWPAGTAGAPLWVALHARGVSATLGPFRILSAYPLLPWIGVMLLGFGASMLFELPAERRKRLLLQLGLGLVLAFLVLRALDVYGDPRHWAVSARGAVYTIMSFLNTSKYPPSLLYLLMTLGPAAVVCAYAENWGGPVKTALVTLGRVPFAFYVAHIYLIHLIAVALGLMQGFTLEQMMVLFIFFPSDYGIPLAGVYLAWALVVVALYPLCRWVAAVKARRRDWWLSYV